MERKRILLIDDETAFASSLKLGLTKKGYYIDIADSVMVADKLLKSKLYDLILLDVNLPQVNGFEYCKKLKKINILTPIIFISARHEAKDKIEGLQIGGDDYLSKPFHLEELYLRIQKAMKYNTSKENKKTPINIFSFDKNYINFNTLTFQNYKKEYIKLTDKEMKLLNLFINHPNTIITREKIYSKIWDEDFFIPPRTLDNYILKFRKFFEKDPHHPKYFLNQRKVGYIFKITESN